tara:strand:- start:1566 stop:2918 length:1353 start_codon:yes stop_codon:yes gene_type:complete
MKPNVLFIIIDSLRSDKFVDHAKNHRNSNISHLMKNGTFFPDTISAANATVLSWSALFTSKFPFKTGIRSARFNKLNSNITTSFDVFKKNNYNILGYLPKLSETVGLFPKFDNNDYLYDFYGGLTNGLAEKTIEKLNSNLSTPWFFLVHSMDLHQPITVSKDFDKQQYGKNLYEKKLSEIDYYLGRIIEKIDLNNTILVITSDHGDYIKSITKYDHELNFNQNAKNEKIISKFSKFIPGFLEPVKDKAFLKLEKEKQEKKYKKISELNLREYEKRALLAGKADEDHFLFDELIKVPFLLYGKNIPQKILTSKQIRSVDIFPTLFEFLNIGFETETDGINLKPLIDGMNFPENPAYIESNPLVIKQSNDVVGIRTGDYKYFRDKNDPKMRIHLFDLNKDPLEEKNISSNTKLVDKYEKILYSLIQKNQSDNQENTENSDEIEKELRKLGYV